MYGAILGDIIGSPYEFDRGHKTKEFPLFINESNFTDDTVMTIAVAAAFMGLPDGFTDEEARTALVKQMKHFGRMYWNAGYGNRFFRWLINKNPQPYNSFGNGSAMRVSAVGWLFHDVDVVRHCAKLSAEVTHNHPEGIKGAEATASAIFLARIGSSKEEIKQYIVENFGYDLSRTCDEIRPNYRHVESCQETVPEAITAFLEGDSFEDVIRTAVSLGGDCDTLTAIAGSIAEAFYGAPEELREECRCRLPDPLLEVLEKFDDLIDCGNAVMPYMEYRRDLLGVMREIDEEIGLEKENVILLLHLLDNAEKIARFFEWLWSSWADGKLQATEVEICRAAVKASEGIEPITV